MSGLKGCEIAGCKGKFHSFNRGVNMRRDEIPHLIPMLFGVKCGSGNSMCMRQNGCYCCWWWRRGLRTERGRWKERFKCWEGGEESSGGLQPASKASCCYRRRLSSLHAALAQTSAAHPSCGGPHQPHQHRRQTPQSLQPHVCMCVCACTNAIYNWDR